MQQVDISVAQTQITELLQSALRGEEIIITRDNHPILKLVQVSSQPNDASEAVPKAKFQRRLTLMNP